MFTETLAEGRTLLSFPVKSVIQLLRWNQYMATCVRFLQRQFELLMTHQIVFVIDRHPLVLSATAHV